MYVQYLYLELLCRFSYGFINSLVHGTQVSPECSLLLILLYSYSYSHSHTYPSSYLFVPVKLSQRMHLLTIFFLQYAASITGLHTVIVDKLSLGLPAVFRNIEKFPSLPTRLRLHCHEFRYEEAL
jgi:hypothetical protein